MDFKELNETLQKFLEGDVVSFNAFKRNKMAQQRKQRNQEFVDKYGDELQKSLDKWNETNVMVEIQKIKVLDCEGPIKEPHYQPGEEVKMHEVRPNHFVYCSEKELEKLKAEHL